MKRFTPAARVTEAEGYALVLSTRSGNKTGYEGVSWHARSKRFVAKRPRGRKHIGYFATALEAAVAVAKATAGVAVEKPHEAKRPAGLALKKDGYTLHLSTQRNNKTGYVGVRKVRKGFRAERNNRYVGIFDTAVEAAVAYAKDKEEEQVLEEEIEGELIRASSSSI